MKQEALLKQMIEKHELWTRSDKKEGARACFRHLKREHLINPYFDRNNLRYADFSRTKWSNANFGMSDLSGASFAHAHIREADLRNCTATGADFEAADLTGAAFNWASMEGACFYGANLSEADFTECNLEGADLRTSEMDGINLQGAYVRRIRVENPIHLLFGKWGEVSNDLCAKLMRLNASTWNGGPEAYDRWQKTGESPWCKGGLVSWRAVEFEEKPELWSPGPPPTIWEAVDQLLTEKCKGWKS